METSDDTRRSAFALRVANLSKTFPGTKALDDVSIDVRAGRIHGLLGENGSGKSTLIKVLAGVYSADAGAQFTFGDRVMSADAFSPTAARANGLFFVHQNPALFESMTVSENLAIGRGFPTTLGRIDSGALRRRAQSLLDRFEISAVPDQIVATMRPAERAMLAIARALQDQDERSGSILVLDEPTASLPVHEVELLFDALRRFRRSGQTIVFVSHRLDEVFALADDVSVLRDGLHVGTVETAAVTHDRLVEMIVGRSLTEVYPPSVVPETSEARLEVHGLAGGPVVDATFEVRVGEVLGIAGLLGSGRSELLQMLFGAFPRRSGTIRLDGKLISPTTPTEGIAAGVGFVPEDRLGEAIFADMSVRENMSAGNVGPYVKGLRLRHDDEAGTVRHFIEVFGVRPATDLVPISSLSGGNQQKVVLARWLLRRPALLLLDEPTQGVDIGARSEIYRLVRQATIDGTAVIVVSSDFEELAQVCDRVIVLADGRLTREVKGEELTVDRLTELVLSKRVEAL